MKERIFVGDGIVRRSGEGLSTADRVARERKLREVSAYLYSGWEYDSWGSAPESFLAGGTGFYFVRENDASGPGFGAQILLDRLASGLHFGTDLTQEGVT